MTIPSPKGKTLFGEDELVKSLPALVDVVNPLNAISYYGPKMVDRYGLQALYDKLTADKSAQKPNIRKLSIEEGKSADRAALGELNSIIPDQDRAPLDAEALTKALIAGSGIDVNESYGMGSTSSGSRKIADPRLIPSLQQYQESQSQLAQVKGRIGRETASQMEDIERETGAEVKLLRGRSAEAKSAYEQAKSERTAAIDKLDKMGVRPSQWWYSEDNATSALRMMAVAMGAIAQASGVTKSNDAMDQVNRIIDRDIKAQLADIQKQEGVVGAKTNTLNLLYRELGDIGKAIETARAGMLTKAMWGAKKIAAQSEGGMQSAAANVVSSRAAMDVFSQLGGVSSWSKSSQTGAALLAPALGKIGATVAKSAAGPELKPLGDKGLQDVGSATSMVSKLYGLARRIRKDGYGYLGRHIPGTNSFELSNEFKLHIRGIIHDLEQRGSNEDATAYNAMLNNKWSNGAAVARAISRTSYNTIIKTSHELAAYRAGGKDVEGNIRLYKKHAAGALQGIKRIMMADGKEL